MAGGVGLSAAAGFATNLAVARSLPPARAGDYFLAISAALLVGFVVRFGVDRSVVRDLALAATSGERRAVARSAAWFALVTSGGTLVLIYLVWHTVCDHFFHAPQLALLALPVAVLVASEAGRLILSEALRESDAVVLATMLGNAGRSLLLLGLLLLAWAAAPSPHRLAAMLWATACANTLVFALALGALARRHGARVFAAPPPRWELWDTLQRSRHFFAVTVSGVLVTQSDLLVVGWLFPQDVVARYAVALRLALLLTLPGLASTQWLGPRIAKLTATGQRQALQKSVRATASIMAIPVVAAALVYGVCGRQVIAVLFGAHYESSYPLLILLLIGPLVSGVAGPNGQVLLMGGHTSPAARSTLLVAVVQLVGMVVCGLTWGAEGLAAASSAGVVLLNVVQCALVARLMAMRTDVLANPIALYARRHAGSAETFSRHDA